MKKLWHTAAALTAVVLTSGCNTATSGGSGTTAGPGTTTPDMSPATSQSSQPTTAGSNSAAASDSTRTSTQPATATASGTAPNTSAPATNAAQPSRTTPRTTQSTSPQPASATFPQQFTGKSTKPKATLTVDGAVWTFDAGCNLIQVSTKPASKTQVTITSTSVTKMACPDRKDEEAVLAWLKDRELTFSFTENKLTLANAINTFTFTKS